MQFGQPLAKFQVLSHRMVDMKVREEEARASCLFATLSLDGPADNRARAVSGAKAKIGRNSRFVAQNAIQTHGAIGTTDELALGAYAKRLHGLRNHVRLDTRTSAPLRRADRRPGASPAPACCSNPPAPE